MLAVVPPTVFMPRPRVDSAVIALDRRSAPSVDVPSSEAMMRLVRAGFGQRRKMLRQSLRAELGDQAEAAMLAAGLDPAARAETLRLEDWAALTRAVAG
jgi:16S rRNA (adenine1518-N6/adenine1519-N6)-dimethyltransferase